MGTQNNSVYVGYSVQAFMHCMCLAFLALIAWQASEIYRISNSVSAIDSILQNITDKDENRLEVYNSEIHALQQDIVKLNAYIKDRHQEIENIQKRLDELSKMAIENFEGYNVEVNKEYEVLNLPDIEQKQQTFEDFDNRIRVKINKKRGVQ